MSEWFDAGPREDFADGAMKAVRAGERELLVARVADRFYAAQGRCPHLGGRLSRGILEGTVVRCPLHGSRFDLADGGVVQWTKWSGLRLKLAGLVKPPRPLETYPVRIDEGRVLIALPTSRPSP